MHAVSTAMVSSFSFRHGIVKDFNGATLNLFKQECLMFEHAHLKIHEIACFAVCSGGLWKIW